MKLSNSKALRFTILSNEEMKRIKLQIEIKQKTFVSFYDESIRTFFCNILHPVRSGQFFSSSFY